MAVSIVETPASGSPAYGPNLYTLTSTNSSELSFKYIAQIYSGSTLLGELKSVPHPVDGWGKFNVSNVISAQLSEYVDFDTTPVFSATASVGSFTVDFGEEYISGSETIRTTASVSDTKEYFNGSPFYEEFVDIKSASDAGSHPYFVSSSDNVPNYPLTPRRTILTTEGTKEWLYYYSDFWQVVANLEIRDDETLATASIALPAELRNDIDSRVIAWRVDKTALEASSSLSNLNKWSVRTVDSVGFASSRYISFELMDCSHWDLYNLYYLNRLGGIDSFPFNGRVQKQVRTDRDNYRTIRETINANGNITYNTQNHYNKDYYVSYDNRYTLTSGWVTEQQQDAAIDLQTSPLVWMEKPNGNITPVRIESDSLQIKNRKDGVISVRMVVIENESINRQRL